MVGAGRTAEGKIEGLLRAGADVLVIALRATPTIASWARQGKITWHARAFRPADLRGVVLVVAATSFSKTGKRIFQMSRRLRVFCNVVDDPQHCDFYYPAVVRRGSFQIAVSTGGNSPALAQRLRKQWESQFGPEYGAWVEWLGAERKKLFASSLAPADRRKRLQRLASLSSWEAFVRRTTRSRERES